MNKRYLFSKETKKMNGNEDKAYRLVICNLVDGKEVRFESQNNESISVLIGKIRNNRYDCHLTDYYGDDVFINPDHITYIQIK